MNIENIKALVQLFNKSGLSLMEVSQGDEKIKLEKAFVEQQAPIKSAKTESPVTLQSIKQEENTLNFNNMIDVKSPIVGVFYSSPGPDSDPFVKIGSKVKKGDVLCIIETMKLMNDITADQDGVITDICIKNGDIAEFGQVLFKMF